MAGPQEIEFRPVARLSDQAIRELSLIDYFPPHMSVCAWEQRVKDGRLYALEGIYQGEAKAWALYFVEHCDLGSELVIVAVAGGVPGVDLVRCFSPAWEILARELGCGSVRYHTKRKGLVKLMAAQGYGLGEILYRKIL